MKTSKNNVRVVSIAAVAALFLSTGCSATKSADPAAPAPAAATTPTAMNPTPMPGATAAKSLSGINEVPSNPSAASGTSTIMIGADKMVTGAVEVKGMTATMSHIHEAAAGANGPVIVPLTKTGENTFAPAAGAKLTDAQYESFKAGKLYINVHSAAYPGGEVRMQLWPAK